MSTAENLQVAQKGDLLNLRVAGFEPPRAPMDESFHKGESSFPSTSARFQLFLAR